MRARLLVAEKNLSDLEFQVPGTGTLLLSYVTMSFVSIVVSAWYGAVPTHGRNYLSSTGMRQLRYCALPALDEELSASKFL